MTARPGRHAAPAARHAAPRRTAAHRAAAGRPVAAAAVLCGALAAVIGGVGWALAAQSGRSALLPTGRPPHVSVPGGRRAPAPAAAAARRVARPVALIIPAIGVRTRLIDLGLTSAGTLQVPATTAVAGWYTGSPPPGAVGSAVIAGHVDSVSGPGIFFRLRLLRGGDRVYVRRADGSVAVFAVTSVRQYLKARFPTTAVYGPQPTAQLRLITCGGTFDYATGHYLSNVIAFATLIR